MCSKLFKNYQSFQCKGSDMTSRAWSSFYTDMSAVSVTNIRYVIKCCMMTMCILWWSVWMFVYISQKIITFSSCVKARFQTCVKMFQKPFEYTMWWMRPEICDLYMIGGVFLSVFEYCIFPFLSGVSSELSAGGMKREKTQKSTHPNCIEAPRSTMMIWRSRVRWGVG